MKKLSVKNIIEFRGKTEKGKKKFAADIKLDVEKIKTESGGNYWVRSLSAISKSYKYNDLQYINDKRYELEDDFENTEYKRTKIMYQRNIDILYKFEDFDFTKWRPQKNLIFIKKHKTDSILIIKGLQIKATPDHVFTFQGIDTEEIGAIWFIAKLNWSNKKELGMFSDILYRYLENNFSKNYTVNPKYCIAVDVINNFDVNYMQIQKGEIPAILDTIIDEINKLR